MMLFRDRKNLALVDRSGLREPDGFTLIEVMVAASIMIILCVGVLSVFSFAVQINAGNNLREQALTVLQKEVEYYRSLKYVPNQTQTDPALVAGTYTRPDRTSEDGTVFHISVQITNVSIDTTETGCTLKQIKVTATPAVQRSGWLANLHTDVTFQRVRSN
jgi:type II secretory pathway pseudopilin PulG